MTGPDTDDPLARSLSSGQRATLEAYLDALLEENQKTNLTAIRSRSEAWERHIVECVRASTAFSGARRIIDVGTGGGLPGMVLAILHPEAQVTLLEATEKKAAFLRRTSESLALENVRVLCERAEQAGAVGSTSRASFDFVTARAVASLPTLLELTAPFAATGASLVLLKGERAAEELAASARALVTLGVRHEQTVRHPTATLLFFRKVGPTPSKYPRRSGEPKRKPL